MRTIDKFDVLIACAIMFASLVWAVVTIVERPALPPRYALAGGQNGLVYRLDTRTGAIWLCAGFSCKPVPFADVDVDPTFGLGNQASPR